MSRWCTICTSPYGKEVTSYWKNTFPKVKVFDKYKGLLGYTGEMKNFRMIMRTHILKHNQPWRQAIILRNPKGDPVTVTQATVENFGQKVLEMGMAKISSMPPEDIKLHEVISAQRLVLDSKKLKLSEDMMMVMLGKLFGPELNIVEGEESKNEISDGRGQDEADQQAHPQRPFRVCGNDSGDTPSSGAGGLDQKLKQED